MQLKGKTVFITGGTGGIGIPLVKLLEGAGAKIHAYDIARDGDLIENLDNTCAYLAENTPDILINMAGFVRFDYCENQQLDALIDLNMRVPMRLIQAVLPAMKARNSGQIINIGTMTSLIPLPHVTGYAAAKGGLKVFTDALRRELGGTDITFTLIAPRAVRTPMNHGPQCELNKRVGIKDDTPDMVAGRIFEAIQKGEREVRIGWPERFFAFLNVFAPRIIDQGLQKNREIGEDILNTHNQTMEKENEKEPNHNRLTA
ncbi:MAG: short-chain dehydrogenase [Micavibrio sp. TMED27]|nr:short-chain dehydrogenase [Micavibrio sp.]OUT91395.1 MAG: short-chain dehydrogenase [Micavibrio sp. TMED27]|tara:strand:+ start:8161 stop:8937 length:777 start_codon:yes stop_codon:yes gene_type:complete